MDRITGAARQSSMILLHLGLLFHGVIVHDLGRAIQDPPGLAGALVDFALTGCEVVGCGGEAAGLGSGRLE